MRKLLATAICLCLPLGLASAQSSSKLKSIKKLHIGELGRQPESDLIREKIRIRLEKSGRFSVVEKAEEADATLTGAAGVETVDALLVGVAADVSWGRGRPVYDPVYGPAYDPRYGGRSAGVGVYGGRDRVQSGTGVFRLIDTKSHDTIWVYEVKQAGAGHGSATGGVAERAVKRLLKDTKKADGA